MFPSFNSHHLQTHPAISTLPFLGAQARRVSRRVSQSAVWKHVTAAVDVTVAAERLRKKPSGVVPALNLFNDLSDIYPFGSPMLFHKSLDVLLLLSCTYLVCVLSAAVFRLPRVSLP